jgi:3'-5' exoribonuclease yhaM
MIKDILNYEGPISSQIFMVKQATRALSNNGSAYLSITLQDNSGTLEARKWNVDNYDMEICVSGKLVSINGMMQNYRGHPQLKINELEGVSESEVDLSRFVPSAPVSLDKLKERLNDFISLIQDRELLALTKELIDENYDKYTTYPAAVTVHHAYRGGLLFHSLSICAMAIKACDQYAVLNRDYLIAGSLLHDLGKTRELSSSTAASYTEEGNLLGHITIGAMMVYEKGKSMKIDEEKLTVLTHMILAHHGKLEFGSPKVPLTAEAFALHMLDEMDSKLELLRTAYETTEEGTYTNKITWLDSLSFFKPHSSK